MTLAEEIMLRVEFYGGADKVIRDIDREWGFFLGGKNLTYAQRKRGSTPFWSKSDDRYLEKWGKVYSINKLSKRLGRSKRAILIRLHKKAAIV
jgi:hypothetical protein